MRPKEKWAVDPMFSCHAMTEDKDWSYQGKECDFGTASVYMMKHLPSQVHILLGALQPEQNLAVCICGSCNVYCGYGGLTSAESALSALWSVMNTSL